MSDSVSVSALKAAFGDLKVSEFRGDTRVVVPAEKLFDALKLLKEQQGFDLLVDITCVDYLSYPSNEDGSVRDRYGLVYLVTNTTSGSRLTVRAFVNDPDPVVRSVVSLWAGANWMEREVFDMFGVEFEDHPDLRRILLPDAFVAYPLRKDYPLQGRGERHNFPVLRRADE
jgi:NADH-quinone oxidoreductase subunit C